MPGSPFIEQHPKSPPVSKREVGLYLAQNSWFTKKEEQCSVKDLRKRNDMLDHFKN